MLIRNTLRYMRSLGPSGVVNKAWEKFVSDKKRYRAGIVRRMPELPQYIPCETLPPAGDREHSVLFLVHCFYPERHGGTERFVLNMAAETLRRNGVARVLTMTFGPPAGAKRFGRSILWTEYVYEGIPVTAFCYEKIPLGAFYKRIDEYNSELEEFFSFLCAREHFDVIHAAYAQPYASVLRLCREKGLPYIVTETGYSLCCHVTTMVMQDGNICPGSNKGKRCAVACKSSAVRRPADRYGAASRLLLGASNVAAPSAYTASVYESEFPGLRVRVVPHGIDPSFSNGKPRGDVKRFLYAGNLSPLKGVDTLLQAFRELPGDVSLDIYGTGSFPDVRRLKKQADSRVRFRGAVPPESMPDIYRSVDCVIAPSLCPESYGFSPREALACGCLLLAARLGALPEAVTEGKNGFLFSSGDTRELRDAMLRAMTFDMTGYTQSSFPTPSLEADEYERMYFYASSN